MSSKSYPPPYEPGDKWDAETANELREAMIEGSKIVAGPGILVQESAGGQVVISSTQEEQVAAESKFLAVITASALQSGHAARWDYTFAEIELTPTAYQLKDGGRTGTAINTLERNHAAEPAANVAWYVWGVQSHSGVTGSAYPAGFRPRPFGGGGTSGTHKGDTIAEVTQRTDTDGNTIYTISEVGSHDGTCSA